MFVRVRYSEVTIVPLMNKWNLTESGSMIIIGPLAASNARRKIVRTKGDKAVTQELFLFVSPHLSKYARNNRSIVWDNNAPSGERTKKLFRRLIERCWGGVNTNGAARVSKVVTGPGRRALESLSQPDLGVVATLITRCVNVALTSRDRLKRDQLLVLCPRGQWRRNTPHCCRRPTDGIVAMFYTKAIFNCAGRLVKDCSEMGIHFITDRLTCDI